MSMITKLFCVVCMMLCAACESGTTDEKGDDNNQENDVNKYSQPYDKTIGNGDYNIHNFMGENPTFITDYSNLDAQAKSAAKTVNAYLEKAKTYTNGLANKFEQSLNGRPAAQNYFSNIINTMKGNSYFHIEELNPGSQNFDAAINKNFIAGKQVFTDIIKNLENNDEREAFEYCYRVLANETYKEGLGNYRNFNSPLMDNYETEKNKLISRFLSNTYLKDIDLTNIYGKNNLKEFTPITNYTNVLLEKFVKNINAKQNLDLQVSDMQQFINISLTLNSLGAMHDHSKTALTHKYGCLIGNGLGFYNDTMHTAADEAWKEEQQYQQLYQDKLLDY